MMKSHSDIKECPECNGVGRLLLEVEVSPTSGNPYGYPLEEEFDCDNCGGSGEIEVSDLDLLDE